MLAIPLCCSSLAGGPNPATPWSTPRVGVCNGVWLCRVWYGRAGASMVVQDVPAGRAIAVFRDEERKAV